MGDLPVLKSLPAPESALESLPAPKSALDHQTKSDGLRQLPAGGLRQLPAGFHRQLGFETFVLLPLSGSGEMLKIAAPQIQYPIGYSYSYECFAKYGTGGEDNSNRRTWTFQ